MSFAGEPNPAEQALSPTLGILPLKDRVLLPWSAMKLVLTHPRDVALVDHALSSGNVASGTLLVGVAVGTYSSIYVAAPLTELIDRRVFGTSIKRKKRRVRRKKKDASPSSEVPAV